MLGSAFACLSCADAFLWYVWPIIFFNSKEGFSTNDKKQNKQGEKTRKKSPKKQNRQANRKRPKTKPTITQKKPKKVFNTDQFMML